MVEPDLPIATPTLSIASPDLPMPSPDCVFLVGTLHPELWDPNDATKSTQQGYAFGQACKGLGRRFKVDAESYHPRTCVSA